VLFIVVIIGGIAIQCVIGSVKIVDYETWRQFWSETLQGLQW